MFSAEDDLRTILAARSQGRIAHFKPGQWETISALLDQREEGGVLLIQRTGWGKSLVYFAAALGLRGRGEGPVLLISPLVSLMRDQVSAAHGLGIDARAFTGAAGGGWDDIGAALIDGSTDIVMMSPEKLASCDGTNTRLKNALARVSLLAIDEAHCLSDWGHDFRPDYRRIRRLIAGNLSPRTPVLATTATANSRVIEDLKRELGLGRVVSGPLIRNSLALQIISLPSLAHRYAWIAERLPHLPGSGIVYVQTRRGAEQLAAWLSSRGIDAPAYHAGLADDGERVRLEDSLREGRVKALTATSALGMGFDKPDLSFVFHLGTPLSPAHYYQQVGRAGRALERAHGVLLPGPEDDALARRLIGDAYPPQAALRETLDAIEDCEDGISERTLAAMLDWPEATVRSCLRVMAAEETPPIRRSNGRWRPTFHSFTPDSEEQERRARQRLAEWDRMTDYAAHHGCLMRFLTGELGDPDETPCGRCANCLGRPALSPRVSRRELKCARNWMAQAGVKGDLAPSPGWVRAVRALFRI